MSKAPRLRNLAARVPELAPRLATCTSWRSTAKGSAARGYGHQWRLARLQYLEEHPLCMSDDCKDRPRVADVVDHVVPHRGDHGLFWDQSNWQALCKPCHDAKTRAEQLTGGAANV